jgi:hypothetical protein
MGRSWELSIVSHVFVAISTAILVSSLYSFGHSEFELSRGSTKQTNFKSQSEMKSTFSQIDPTTDEAPLFHSASKASKRIDLYSCPDHRLRVAPEVDYLLGMGHKMTQVFFVFWYAITRGHCFCFDTNHFGSDMDLYHLLLEPVYPPCEITSPNRTLQHTRVHELEGKDTALMARNETVIQWIYPDSGEVWRKYEQEKMPPGHGDVLAFVDSFLRDNRLVEEVIYPWYQQHKDTGTIFWAGDNNSTTASTTNSTRPIEIAGRKVLNAAFHLRVGDVVLEASESYWRNVFRATRDIVELEHGSGHTVHIHWVYFQTSAGGSSRGRVRESLSHNVLGEWPSEPKMLPKSHLFLAKLCQEFDGFECFWKSGTNILESINLFVESDIVYASGSSFSQVLSLFNQGIRLLALPKEINWFGSATKGSINFLQASTTAYSSLRYYYFDGTGELLDEQYAHLRLNHSNLSYNNRPSL